MKLCALLVNDLASNECTKPLMFQLARKERRRRWIPKKNKIFIIQLFNGAASHKDLITATRRGEFRSHGATPSLSHTFMVLDSSTFRVENMDQPTRAPASSTKQLTTCHSNATRCLVKGDFDLQGKLLDSSFPHLL
jgi:hypothetical protein